MRQEQSLAAAAEQASVTDTAMDHGRFPSFSGEQIRVSDTITL
jgi:hypothetical protein